MSKYVYLLTFPLIYPPSELRIVNQERFVQKEHITKIIIQKEKVIKYLK